MTISGVTYDSNAMTMLAQANNAGVAVSQIWYLLAPASGTKTIAITTAGTARKISAGSRTYSGVHQTTSWGTAVTATGASTTPSVTISSASGELVIDHAMGAGTDTFTVGSGQTERYNVVTGGGGPPNQNARSAGSEEAGAASVTMDWTIGASISWATVGAPLKSDGAAVSVSMFTFSTGM
jgi:hypothetical protein